MQTVTKWEREGLPCAERGRAGRPSFYRPDDVRAWLKEREDAAKGNSPFADATKAKAEREMAQARLANQMFLTRAGQLLPLVDVERIWLNEVSAVRAKLLAIPTAYADRIHRASTLDGVAGVERMLEEAIRDVLRELADPDRDIVEDKQPEPPPS